MIELCHQIPEYFGRSTDRVSCSLSGWLWQGVALRLRVAAPGPDRRQPTHCPHVQCRTR